MPSQKGHSADDHRDISEREHDRDDDRQLSCEISLLTRELHEVLEVMRNGIEWFKSHSQLATKCDLKEMENKLMAVLAEVVADLKEAIANAKQTNLDIAEVQKKINELTTKVKELEDAIAAGGTSQELVELAKEVKALTKAADDALPNPIVVPDVPV